MAEQNKLFFMEWLGKRPEDKFGFAPKVHIHKKPFYLEQPIEEFNVVEMLDELKSMGDINGKVIDDSWSNMLVYGKGVGKIEIDTSPLGSFKLIIRRYVNDKKGKRIAICRRVVPLINDFNHRGPNDPSESIVATKLFDELKVIDAEPFEVGKSDWKDNFTKLVHKFAKHVKVQHPTIMVYEGLLKLNDLNYLLSFTYKGFGNGLPQNQKAERFLINMQYLPEEGLVHSWGYEVASKMKVRSYYVTPSEWDEYFCPTQGDSEIIKNLHEIFMTY